MRTESEYQELQRDYLRQIAALTKERDEAVARIAALEKLLTECKAYIAHTHWPGCTALKSTIDAALAGKESK